MVTGSNFFLPSFRSSNTKHDPAQVFYVLHMVWQTHDKIQLFGQELSAFQSQTKPTLKTEEAEDSPASLPLPLFCPVRPGDSTAMTIHCHFPISITMLLPLFCMIYLILKCRFSSEQSGSSIDSFYEQRNQTSFKHLKHTEHIPSV